MSVKNEDSRRRKASFLLGALLCGNTQDALVQYLSHTNLTEDERLVYVHAMMIRKQGDIPSAESVLKSIANEPWAASVFMTDFKNMIDDLCCFYYELKARYGLRCAEALSILANGCKYEEQVISKIIRIDILEPFACLHNLTLVEDITPEGAFVSLASIEKEGGI